MLSGVEKSHAQKGRLGWLKRWRWLYMSGFCQIPLSLRSSCYRPNPRGPLLLLAHRLVAQESHSFPTFRYLVTAHNQARLRIACRFFVRPTSLPGSIPQLAWAADREEELVECRTISLLENAGSCFSLPFPPLRNNASSHSPALLFTLG